MKGQIFRVISGFYDVKVGKEIYRVRGAGKLRKNDESPLVGDFVEFTPDGMLEKILPRRNSLIRPKVANVDQVAIVQSLKDPDYSSKLLNKFLAIVESENIKPIIIFTKIDKVKETPLEEYIKDGYEAYVINNNDRKTLKQLANVFKNKLTVFTGQTGAGKSTTINNLSGSKQETQMISKSLGRGKHTTRVVEIIEWLDGYLIDTPGFSSLGIEHLSKHDLSVSYHDFKKYSTGCKFNDCLHYHEKECSVKQAIRDGKISNQRYQDYISLLKEKDNE